MFWVDSSLINEKGETWMRLVMVFVTNAEESSVGLFERRRRG